MHVRHFVLCLYNSPNRWILLFTFFMVFCVPWLGTGVSLHLNTGHTIRPKNQFNRSPKWRPKYINKKATVKFGLLFFVSCFILKYINVFLFRKDHSCYFNKFLIHSTHFHWYIFFQCSPIFQLQIEMLRPLIGLSSWFFLHMLAFSLYFQTPGVSFPKRGLLLDILRKNTFLGSCFHRKTQF